MLLKWSQRLNIFRGWLKLTRQTLMLSCDSLSIRNGLIVLNRTIESNTWKYFVKLSIQKYRCFTALFRRLWHKLFFTVCLLTQMALGYKSFETLRTENILCSKARKGCRDSLNGTGVYEMWIAVIPLFHISRLFLFFTF